MTLTDEQKQECTRMVNEHIAAMTAGAEMPPREPDIDKLSIEELKEKFLHNEDVMQAQAVLIHTMDIAAKNLVAVLTRPRELIKDKTIVFVPATGRTFIWDGKEEVLEHPQMLIVCHLQEKRQEVEVLGDLKLN